MAFSTAEISNVKAMMFPAGIGPSGSVVGVPLLALVSWRSGETDKLFQVYVDGGLAGVTMQAAQRMLLVQCEHGHTTAIEVVAVEAADIDVDHSDQLSGFTEADGAHVVLAWPRYGRIGLGVRAVIYGDGGTGTLDFDAELADCEVWVSEQDKWGWGLDAFGRSDFGYSGSGAIGWGRGEFGDGEFGFDADAVVFESEALEVGTYKFAVRTVDRLGNFDEGETIDVQVSVDPLPRAADVAIESYDETNDRLTLNIS